MKRRIPVFLLAAVMAAVSVLPAFADVIWEPNNNFYESHRYECSYKGRNYLTNGGEGYVTLRAAPDSLIEVVNVVNGVELYVGFTWQGEDGEAWAVCDYGVQEQGTTWNWYSGWVSMDELALIYDYISFEEDHGAEFLEYDGSGDGLTAACLYSYPGGPYADYIEIEAGEHMPFSEAFQSLYTDEAGLRWTYLGYYMGRRNAWVCLDDPLNQNLGPEGYRTVAQVRGGAETIVPAAEQAPDGTDGARERGLEEELIPPAEKVPAAKTYVTWLVPAALIVAVAVVTAVLVRRRNRNK